MFKILKFLFALTVLSSAGAFRSELCLGFCGCLVNRAFYSSRTALPSKFPVTPVVTF